MKYLPFQVLGSFWLFPYHNYNIPKNSNTIIAVMCVPCAWPIRDFMTHTTFSVKAAPANAAAARCTSPPRSAAGSSACNTVLEGQPLGATAMMEKGPWILVKWFKEVKWEGIDSENCMWEELKKIHRKNGGHPLETWIGTVICEN